MTVLLAVVRAVLVAVVVVCLSLAVLWSVTGAPGPGGPDRVAEVTAAVFGAVLLRAALPGKSRGREDGDRDG